MRWQLGKLFVLVSEFDESAGTFLLNLNLFELKLEEKSGGTQIKLKVRFDNGMYALAKLMRY